MLHSRTKTVKAYGKRSNTRVINIHHDFHEAVLSGKRHTEVPIAQSGNRRSALQDKLALNVVEDSSTDDDSDDNTGRDGKFGLKAGVIGMEAKAKPRPKTKGGARKKVVSPHRAALSLKPGKDTSDSERYPAFTNSSTRTAGDIGDPSYGSATRSTSPSTVQESLPSSRPVLRQRRNRRKIVESSDDSDYDDDRVDKESSTASDPEMGDSQEPEIVAGLKELSMGSDTDGLRLSDLFAMCSQDSAHDFTSFIETHVITSASEVTKTKKRGKHAPSMDDQHNVFRKIGEASYSEVFGVWTGTSSRQKESPKVVMKVVPLDMQSSGMLSRRSAMLDTEAEDDEVCLTKVEDIAKEIQITRLMNGVHEGFVKLHEAHVVRGAYPERLLSSWDAFKKERGSESPRPDCLSENQYYMLLFLENGGTDLESYQFDKSSGWKQAVEVLWQVADALHIAEKEAEFEHRDLHEGQVLLSETETGEIRTTIIDFGLSRATSPLQNEPIYSKIPEDVFDGQGEQWDVYRAMKKLIECGSNDWDSFYPATNLMWLHYLSKRLLYATPSLVKPRSKALSRVISRRDPTRSPMRRRTTRNTAAALTTPMPIVNLDHGAELEAWEKLRRFEVACKAGLAECTNGKSAQGGRPARSGHVGKAMNLVRAGGRSVEAVASTADAASWFVDED